MAGAFKKALDRMAVKKKLVAEFPVEMVFTVFWRGSLTRNLVLAVRQE